MTASSTSSNSGFRYGNPALECGGAKLRGQCRQLATVVTITGTLDATNIDVVMAQAKRYVVPEKPVILDLSGITSFAPEGISLLDSVDEGCDAIGEPWILVSGTQVSRTLRLCGVDGSFPALDSVAEALQDISEAVCARRRLLPILRKSA